MEIKIIGFDADDTLWVNEPFFRQSEEQFCKLLADFGSETDITKQLLDTEIKNLNLYGYGIKGFVLSLIETALKITDNKISPILINQILDLGKKMLDEPVELLEDVEFVLQSLSGKYRLILATKGDLLDQQRKLNKSGLVKYFHHIEVMTDKKEKYYERIIKHLDIKPEEFLMVGNSLKSDIFPVLNIGAHAIHIPFHTTWIHEHSDELPDSEHFREVKKIKDILDYL
jgi:putative hydrolase of the HAD superfamily